ncbi:hypothetical protein J7E88_32265 [Streptomyces sp. ISL-10]|uniref:hypothetical protein n=1 Tax=Streptomyces sp. ISL-10 TaxID=2819172 RepID=UPI001BE58589|nr:hypothetical protein [Streptomyces sp. ISL-10]MBT2369822.1 hypothetical protein [Streptomyces sp. ISL-10]
MTPMPGARADGEWIVWDMGAPLAPQTETAYLPEDFYMRELLEADPGDLHTVASWMRAYGRLGGSLEWGSWDSEELDRLREFEEREHPQFGPWSLHGDLVRLHICEAQRAVATWLSCRREGALDALVETEVSEEHLAQAQAENSHRDDVYPRDLDDLRDITLAVRLAQLRWTLGGALAPFSVGLGSLTDRCPSILSVAFLQLYNHMAEEATVRECASETCRRSFVRQRGRAEYGQNRTSGIKYCTRECARAQAQRELRRRRRQQAPAATAPAPHPHGTKAADHPGMASE